MAGIVNDMPDIIPTSDSEVDDVEEDKNEAIKEDEIEKRIKVYKRRPKSIKNLSDCPSANSISNFIHDLIDFTSTEKPPSIKADEEGIRTAQFIIEHADLAKAVKKQRDDLDIEVNGPFQSHIPIQVTYFKNWAGNQGNGLLLYVKPKTVDQVQRVVKAAKNQKLKVSKLCILITVYFKMSSTHSIDIENKENLIQSLVEGFLCICVIYYIHFL